jgi:hypothetical protein
MSIGSTTARLAAIASPPTAPRTFGEFNRWWASMDPAERRALVETERKLFGDVGFETGLSTDFLSRNYGKRREGV